MTPDIVPRSNRRDTAPEELPPGMIEYQARVAIQDLVRLLGFERAREHIAEIITDESGKKWS